jgi:hypothetical protein
MMSAQDKKHAQLQLTSADGSRHGQLAALATLHHHASSAFTPVPIRSSLNGVGSTELVTATRGYCSWPVRAYSCEIRITHPLLIGIPVPTDYSV